MIQSFSPVVDDNTRLIILGSMPGQESLRIKQYYGFKRNHFWKILFTIFDEDEVEDYSAKLKFLTRKNIGLWDVLKYCERKGSLDSNIKNGEPNDFYEFFRKYEKIEYVIFNGTKAESIFLRKYKNIFNYKIKFLRLPSTSPANIITFENKMNKWNIIKEILEGEYKQ